MSIDSVNQILNLEKIRNILNFDPSQARDSIGRWSSGGDTSRVSVKSGKLSSAEKSAVDSFSGSWGTVINDILRKDEINSPKNAEFKNIVDSLDSAIDKNVLDKETTVFRGVRIQTNITKSTYKDEFTSSGKKKGGQKDPFQGSEGKLLENKGYSSTTTSRQSALNFAKAETAAGAFVDKPPEYRSYVVELKLPKGTKALDMGKTGVFQQNLVGHEKELLLPRGMKMKIESIKPLSGYDPGQGISSKSTMHVVKATLVKA